jgi:hypothetical protein
MRDEAAENDEIGNMNDEKKRIEGLSIENRKSSIVNCPP